MTNYNFSESFSTSNGSKLHELYNDCGLDQGCGCSLFRDDLSWILYDKCIFFKANQKLTKRVKLSVYIYVL